MTGLQVALVLALIAAGVAAFMIPYYLIEMRPRSRHGGDSGEAR